MSGDANSHAALSDSWVAWLLAWAIPLVVLLGILLVARPTEEAAATPPGASTAVEVEAEEAEEEWESEEGEDEEVEEEEAESASQAPECVLRRAHAHAVVKDQKLKLTVGYTTYEPVSARIEIRSGSSWIGSAKRHLGRSGVLRIVKKLGANASTERLSVRFRIAGYPASCGKLERAIQVRH